MKPRYYQCRDCENVYQDRTGDHCPECGGADLIPIGSADAPIPNVGRNEVYIELVEMGSVVIGYQGKEYEVVGTEDGPELRSRE